MAPKTGEDFVLKISQYYKAQEPYVELLKQAIEREPDNDHHGDSKHRYTDVHRELAERVTKPMSSFNWDAGFGEKEMAKAFGNLEVEVKNKDIVDEKRASKT